MTLSTKVTLFLMSVVLLGAAAFTYWVRSNHTAVLQNEAARDLYPESVEGVYTDLHGKGIDLRDLAEDQVVVVTSWASWCPQCDSDLKLINEVVGERPDGTVRALAVNRREPKEQAARYLLTVPELPKLTYILDTEDYYFGAIEGYAMPETLVYNQRGEVVLHKRGNLTAEELRAALETALQN